MVIERLSGLMLVALVVVSTPGCLFDTRDPESGDVEVCFEEVPAINFGEVFTNLDGALRCFQASTYLAQLDETFEYIPAPGVSGLPDEWGKEQEEAFIGGLFSDAQSIQSSLRVADVNPPSGETVVLVEASYAVTVTYSDGSSVAVSGEALYTLEQIASSFVMTRWEEKSSASPMALLRARS